MPRPHRQSPPPPHADRAGNVGKRAQVIVDDHLAGQGKHDAVGVGLLAKAHLIELSVLEFAVRPDLLEGKAAGHAVAGVLLEVVDRGDLADLPPGVLDIVVALEKHLIGDIREDARQGHRRKRCLQPAGGIPAESREMRSPTDPFAELLDTDAAKPVGGV